MTDTALDVFAGKRFIFLCTSHYMHIYNAYSNWNVNNSKFNSYNIIMVSKHTQASSASANLIIIGINTIKS